MIGSFLKQGDIVVYESTVYPGVTRDICIPILENKSKLKLNHDFFVEYNSERINPGDKSHRVNDITKVVSGSDAYSLKAISLVYKSIIDAGIHKASSIEVAESCKRLLKIHKEI